MCALLSALFFSIVVVNVAHADYSEGVWTGSTSGHFTAGITVDGSLTDWQTSWIVNGLTPQVDRSNSDWLPQASGVCYWIEDGVGSPHGRVGPGYGGQNFDHEAAYMGATGHSLELAIVTGGEQAGNYGWSYGTRYDSGDIFFDLNADSQWDFAVAAANHNGLSAGHVYRPTDGFVGGQWWTNCTDFSISSPSQMDGCRVEEIFDLGSDFIYTNAVTCDDNRLAGQCYHPYDHNVIELSIPFGQLYDSGFQVGSLVQMHFTQTCGNDIIEMDCSVIPEPATLTLLSSGLIGLIYVKRRRRRSGGRRSA